MFVLVYVVVCMLVYVWYNDTIAFINLTTRTDRLALTRREFERMCIDASRIDGQIAPTSIMGCSKSHLLALQTGFRTVYEDDICFNVDASTFSNSQNVWQYVHYDVVMIASRIVDYEPTILRNIVRVTKGYTSAGYMVHPAYVSIFIENINQGMQNNIPIDVHWQSLQCSGNWFGYASVMAYQRDGYSDIERRFTRYNDKVPLQTSFDLRELVLTAHAKPNAMQILFADVSFLDLHRWRMYVRNETDLNKFVKLILNHNGWTTVKWE